MKKKKNYRVPCIRRYRAQFTLVCQEGISEVIHGILTNALSVLDALVSLAAELEVVATCRRDPVVEQGAPGHEVAQPDALATAVIDLHVLDHNAVHGGQEVITVVQLQVSVLAGACKRATGTVQGTVSTLRSSSGSQEFQVAVFRGPAKSRQQGILVTLLVQVGHGTAKSSKFRVQVGTPCQHRSSMIRYHTTTKRVPCQRNNYYWYKTPTIRTTQNESYS